jgi:hypothetical protein
MNNNNNLVIIFLMAGMLFTTTAVTTMIPVAYAGGDDDGDDEPPELGDDDENPEIAKLNVCKEGDGHTRSDTFVVTGENPQPPHFVLAGPDCQEVNIGPLPGRIRPSEYHIDGPIAGLSRLHITGDCKVDPDNSNHAIGKIEAAQVEFCVFEYTPLE